MCTSGSEREADTKSEEGNEDPASREPLLAATTRVSRETAWSTGQRE